MVASHSLSDCMQSYASTVLGAQLPRLDERRPSLPFSDLPAHSPSFPGLPSPSFALSDVPSPSLASSDLPGQLPRLDGLRAPLLPRHLGLRPRRRGLERRRRGYPRRGRARARGARGVDRRGARRRAGRLLRRLHLELAQRPRAAGPLQGPRVHGMLEHGPHACMRMCIRFRALVPLRHPSTGAPRTPFLPSSLALTPFLPSLAGVPLRHVRPALVVLLDRGALLQRARTLSHLPSPSLTSLAFSRLRRSSSSWSMSLAARRTTAPRRRRAARTCAARRRPRWRDGRRPRAPSTAPSLAFTRRLPPSPTFARLRSPSRCLGGRRPRSSSTAPRTSASSSRR